MAWVKLRLVHEERERAFNLDQAIWWEGFGDECEIAFPGTGAIRVKVSHYEMALLTQLRPLTVGD